VLILPGVFSAAVAMEGCSKADQPSRTAVLNNSLNGKGAMFFFFDENENERAMSF
jgi:hypothetical protein